jgi:NAD+ kinase
MPIERVGLVVNIDKKEILGILADILAYIPERVKIFGLEEVCSLLPEKINRTETLDHCDVIIALGGDGTLLTAARLVEKTEIPLLGIKFRSLGFLTEDDPKEAVESLFNGHYVIQDRTRLEVTVSKNKKTDKSYSALNDVVIHGVGVSRVIHLETTIDGVILGEYLADGVIIATPTGSTAYSLSANGPIVNPTSVDAFIVTPLYPHSLSVRPIVISSEEKLTVQIIEQAQDVLLTIDGQKACNINRDELILLQKSKNKTRLIVTRDYNFYDLVRRKLEWGGVLRRR